MRGVHSFQDLPQLFTQERKRVMGYQQKKTPELLDRIVQIVWHFQQLHGGATPSREVIANEIGGKITLNSITYYITKLVEQDRLERIGTHAPLRLTIRHHTKNTAAINRYKKLLEKIDHLEAKAEASKPAPAQTETPTSPAAQIEPAAPPEISRDIGPRKSFVPERQMNWNEAQQIVAAHGGNLQLIAESYIIKTSRAGVLLEELLERGYTISKGRN